LPEIETRLRQAVCIVRLRAAMVEQLVIVSVVGAK
jgi:hypothetical protein